MFYSIVQNCLVNESCTNDKMIHESFIRLFKLNACYFKHFLFGLPNRAFNDVDSLFVNLRVQNIFCKKKKKKEHNVTFSAL